MEGGVTVKYRIDRAQARRKPTLVKPEAAVTTAPPPPKVSPDRTARMLALAHHIERLIDQDVLKDYADVARRFGLSRARVTQIANLLSLSPKIQEAILAGKASVAERRLRLVLRESRWQEQERVALG